LNLHQLIVPTGVSWQLLPYSAAASRLCNWQFGTHPINSKLMPECNISNHDGYIMSLEIKQTRQQVYIPEHKSIVGQSTLTLALTSSVYQTHKVGQK